jgi:hypothetical protein
LLAKQPERGPGLLGWLCTVAIREGYRLSGLERWHDRLDVHAGRSGRGAVRAELVEDLRACLERQQAARAALARVAALGPRHRELFALQGVIVKCCG